ncbi:tetratricopeptide repeat protein [Sphingobium aromaticiconvertens]|uniref:tetratricopeptide repeat protein n=1 Tax=Sphingobium aromaticiconvertens TaxID=365341 RepID=UPI00301856A4
MNLVDPASNSLLEINKSKLPPTITFYLARNATKRARAAARRQDWAVAVETYLQALRLTPKEGRLWVQLGHAYGHLALPEAAERAYLNATHAQPDYVAGHRHLGYVRRGTHLHDQAMGSLARALLLEPTDRSIAEIFLAEKGEAGTQESLNRAALAHADECRSDRPLGLQAGWLRSKARKAARRQEWKSAEKLYVALTRIQPGNPDAYLQLGHTLNEQNRQPEAELAYRRAIGCDPLYADPWLHLGYVLTAQNQHGAAREAFATVLRLAPNRLDAHPILASAQSVQEPFQDLTGAQAMACPPYLGEREKAIWNLLATHIQSRH